MKFTNWKFWSLSIVLGPVLTGCRERDSMAEAPPPVQVESEDFNVVRADHPEQFQVAAAIEHVSASELTVIGTVVSSFSRNVPIIPINNPRAVDVHGRLNARRQSALIAARIVCHGKENDLAAVQIGDAVQVRLNADPDKVFIGRVSGVGPVLGPIRTVQVRIEARNAGLLRARRLATVTFRGQRNETYAAIPVTAILHTHDRDWIYVPAGNGKFRRVDVFVRNILSTNMAEIGPGIRPGQQVVANAAALQTAVEILADKSSSEEK